MDFLFLLFIVLGFFALCLLAMAVGVIIRKRGFTTCGSAGITFRGERINCPACQDQGGATAPAPKACSRRSEKRCDGDGDCGGA